MSFRLIVLKVLGILRDVEGYLLLLFAVTAFAMHLYSGPFNTRVIDFDYFWLALLCLSVFNSLFWRCGHPNRQT